MRACFATALYVRAAGVLRTVALGCGGLVARRAWSVAAIAAGSRSSRRSVKRTGAVAVPEVERVAGTGAVERAAGLVVAAAVDLDEQALADEEEIDLRCPPRGG
jgi:hypothetical protein